MGAAEEEELMVAMAMSRSLHEEAAAARARLLARGRQSRARQGRKNPRGGQSEKKSRVMPPQSPPTLLLQDPEEARRHTEARVALLLAEADQFPGAPPPPPPPPLLPPSRLLASQLSRKAGWPVALPKGPPSSLWARSSLVGPSAPGPAWASGSTLPAAQGQADQRPLPSTALPLLGSDRPEATGLHLLGGDCGSDLRGPRPQEEAAAAEGCRQEEGGALQDLMELAGEGLTLTQWDPAAQQAEGPGPEGMPGDVPWSHLLHHSLEEEEEEESPPSLGSLSPPFLLGSLAAAFRGMVNNPHLSDVQFQVDSGELFYAHLFVLYARCPQLMEVVDQTGFWVAEGGGEAQARRVLLADVSGEAAGVFLSYLYTAQHLVPQHVRADVAALALRFGVAELAALCTGPGWSGPSAVAASGQEEVEGVEPFEELLKSIWEGEEEEDGALLPEKPGRENVVDEQELEEIYTFAATQREAEEEAAVPGGSSAGEPGPRPPLEPGEKSLLAVSWGAESWELFPGSPSGKEPSEEGAAALPPSSTPLGSGEGPVLLPGGASPVPLGVPAERLPASPRERGGCPSGSLSLPLSSPAAAEASGKPCPAEEQEAAASRGAGNPGRAPALPPSPPTLLTPGPADGREREASGAVDVGCWRGRGASLPGTLPRSSEAGAGGERPRGPGPAGGPNGGQVARLGLAAGPPSPRRQSLQGWLPHGRRRPPPQSLAADAVVVILDDSEEEAEAAPRLSGGSSVLEAGPPIFEEGGGHLFRGASPERPMAAQAGRCQLGSPPRPLRRRSGTPPGGSRTAGEDPSPRSGCPEEGSHGSDGSVWGQILALPRRLPAPVPVPRTPELFCQEGAALCTTPPTPVPSYSIMETPVLKKELSRFGVRTLPKRQMVLKLKEIFQYTRQRPDSREAAASSEPGGLCRGAQAARRRPASAAARRGFPRRRRQQQQLPGCPEFPQVLLAGERFGGSSGAGDPGQVAQKGAAEGPAGGGRALAASREAGGDSGAASDTSVVLQSSSTEFESSVLAEEEEEDVPASQSTCRKADVLVALRQHIRSRPALCRQILFYQPFELARLQSELKQDGIRIALGRLLEFLDAHCITFTTAEARREKRQQSERQGGRRGRRY